MTKFEYLERRLTGVIAGEEHRFVDAELIARPENLIILGEAGMGKSALLCRLKSADAKLITARSFIAGSESPELLDGAATILIDAIDEAPAYRDGDAVDRVLERLARLDPPRFILSCRAEEWQTATARELIREAYGIPPLELHLLPFDEEQAHEFLREHLKNAKRADEVMATYQERDLEDWLGNPHTLSMLADVAAEGALPDTTKQLFDAFVNIALDEQNAKRRETSLGSGPIDPRGMI